MQRRCSPASAWPKWTGCAKRYQRSHQHSQAKTRAVVACMCARVSVYVRARGRVCVYVYVFACAALLGDEEDFVLSSAMLCLAKVRQSRTLLCTPTDKPPARKRSSCTSACALACTHRWTYACTYAWMTHACVHACMRCCAAVLHGMSELGAPLQSSPARLLGPLFLASVPTLLARHCRSILRRDRRTADRQQRVGAEARDGRDGADRRREAMHRTWRRSARSQFARCTLQRAACVMHEAFSEQGCTATVLLSGARCMPRAACRALRRTRCCTSRG